MAPLPRVRPVRRLVVACIAALALALSLAWCYANLHRVETLVSIECVTPVSQRHEGREYICYVVIGKEMTSGKIVEFSAFGEPGRRLRETRPYYITTVPDLPDWLVWLRRAPIRDGWESPKTVRLIDAVREGGVWSRE